MWSVGVERVGCGVQGMEREVAAWTVRAAWTVWTVWGSADGVDSVGSAGSVDSVERVKCRV